MGKKEPENPNHHMGKRTGYHLINGEYHIAPLYVEQFDKLTNRQAGIKKMLAAVTENASEQLAQIAESYKRVWDELADDLGLDRNEVWTIRNEIVKKQEKPGSEAKKE